MGMTIDEDIEMLEYIRQDFRGCRQGVALEDAIDTMHKYQKIEQIVTNILNNTVKEDERYVYDYLGGIIEVVEDGNVD